ncbi:MAG TPA: tol-pal system-associated acyl-CoA thioesterase [Alphaproteobacteria bacterium]
MTTPHSHSIRVYYEDTDAQGIVYHTNYLKFAERARTEMLRAVGFNHADLARDEGIVFVMRKAEIDYMAPAKLDDELEVHTSVANIGNASITLEQNIRRNDATLVACRVVLVCISSDGKPVRVPLAARQAFATHEFSN